MMRAAVLGHPVRHSLSPLIHGYWLDRLGLAGSYEKIDVAPEGLPGLLDRLAADGYRGVNITIPHKEHAFRLLSSRAGDVIESAAAAVGAVNTLAFEADGRRRGDNTDGYGFLAWLRRRLGGENGAGVMERLRVGPVVVLGAGGAGRGVAKALLDDGFSDVRVRNRTRERAEKLSSAFAGRLRVMDPAEPLPGDTTLLVNATPAGMDGRADAEISLDPMAPGGVVYDLVYKPLTTGLLRAAARSGRGLVPVDGLGMLIHQAVPAFERFYGVRPEPDDGLYDRCRSALEG